MSGKAFLIVGATGTGKSTFTKNVCTMVPKSSIMLFDVNGEHPEITDAPYDDIEDFLEKANRARNAVIVVEEATIFFDSKRTEKNLVEILIRKRHKNNTILLLFHSFADVPRYIYRKSTHVVIFKTNDEPDQVQERFKDTKLTSAFEGIKNANWLTTQKGNKTVKYSPSVIFDIYKLD
jgi:ABC-type Mn2+/Zn2+ transport system ATPase subunit